MFDESRLCISAGLKDPTVSQTDLFCVFPTVATPEIFIGGSCYGENIVRSVVNILSVILNIIEYITIGHVEMCQRCAYAYRKKLALRYGRDSWGLGIMSAPTCAYAVTTAVTPFNSNSVSTFAAGFAVGLLITAGAFVVYTRVAKRRGRVGESPEVTIGPTEFSMPVGDDPQAVVDVLGLGMASEDQAASLRQVERLALGIEGDIEGLESPKSYEAPADDAAGASHSVREVLSRRLDGNGLGASSIIGRADGALQGREAKHYPSLAVGEP